MKHRLTAIAATVLLLGGLAAAPAQAAPVSTSPAVGISVQAVRCPHRIEVCHLYQWWDVFHWYPGRYCQCYGPYIP